MCLLRGCWLNIGVWEVLWGMGEAGASKEGARLWGGHVGEEWKLEVCGECSG
ncbi:hypothetical protein GGR10_000541 [Bartonella chomelii]|uniref:Uncharacterized protein n=1 Tax=Bartonella chomelii TaxID=236402 RepID=A0ABR6E2B4_9HYPH|nr:hypothetical protein [Bartonella chomelii]MBA9082700.1 hypothetical protein [Bartonella chomelii]